jgi:hypothetical protein
MPRLLHAQDAEVYLTTRSLLRKTRHLAVGKWIVSSARTQRVSYTASELEEIYGST